MIKRTSLAIYNINDERLCTLFDSDYFADGNAVGVEVTKERSGWKEMKFTVPFYMEDGSENFRIQFLKNENLLYYYEGDDLDVYTIKIPTDTHGNKQLNIEVKANHISEELKAKNLYKYFDDENGIGTCQTLVERALAGSGWTLAHCDTFYEADGETEKVRSYSCDTKTGAYTMLSGICELFKARPVFNGYDRTVEIYANQDTDGFIEMNFSKNMEKISRKLDSSNIVTRLYVEGDYGDFGYVGIDSVNPTGLPFILNFDYYKEIGLFEQEHQTALDNYIAAYSTLTEDIREATADMLEISASLIALIGTCGYIYSPILNGTIQTDQMIAGGDYTEADKSYKPGDTMALVKSSGEYVYETYPVANLSPYAHIIKFLPTITGLMAAHEDLIQVSNDAGPEHFANLNKFLKKNNYTELTSINQLRTIYGVTDLSVVDDEDFDVSGLSEPYNLDTVRSYTASIGDAEKTAAETQTALNTEMLNAIAYMKQIDTLMKNIAQWQEDQADADDAFVEAMGTMLRDGYWSDDNYTVGQEESLYQDALDISNTLAFPIKSYNVDYKSIAAVEGFEDEEPALSALVRIYDDVLGIDDYVYIDKTHEYLDNRTKDNVDLTTDLLNLANKSFSTVIDRITELANDVKNNRDIYKRAAAISKDGKFSTDLLEGAISTLTSRLTSTSSNWTTDEKGNLVFVSLDGNSAMMLSGYGFMVASSKNPDGSWNWRTFGTGEGFTADMIITGFLSADRIQANSIVANKLASDVGSQLDISSNVAIQAVVDSSTMTITPDSIISTVALMNDPTKVQSSVRTQLVNAIDSAIVDGDNFSEVSQKADEITWLVADGSTSSSIMMTQAAINAISDQITIQASKINAIADEIEFSSNESIYMIAGQNFDNSFGGALESRSAEIVQMVVGSDEYGNLETRVSQTESDYTITVSRLNQIDEELAPMETWFTFTEDGLGIGKSGSWYTTLTDDTGFHVLQRVSEDNEQYEKISSFAKRQLKVEEIRVGVINTTTNRCLIREAADGGLIITVEGLV